MQKRVFITILLLSLAVLPACGGDSGETGLELIIDISDSNPVAGQEVQFDASPSTTVEGKLSEVLWTIDGEQVGKGTQFTYRFDSAGAYELSVRATDQGGNSATTTRTISVDEAEDRPVALFGPEPQEPVVGQPVEFDASDSQSTNGGNLWYRWNFGVKPGWDREGFDEARPEYTYEEAGSYEVTLVVQEEDFESEPTTKQIEILDPDAEPVADFTTTPTEPWLREEVVFDASASDPVGGEIEEYRWTLGDGSPTVTRDHPVVEHTYKEGGKVTVTLSVTNSLGNTDVTSREVRVRGPAVRFVYDPFHPEAGSETGDVEFDARESFTTEEEIVLYNWDFGDGNGGAGEAPTHTYTDPGSHMVNLEITDNTGHSVSTKKLVRVVSPKSWPEFSRSMDNTGAVLSGNGEITLLPGEAWSQDIGEQGETPPTPVVADIEGTGNLVVLVAGSSAQGKIHAFTTDGDNYWDSPAQAGGYVETSPVAVDLEGDQHREILAATRIDDGQEETGQVVVFHSDGEENWRLDTDAPVTNAPTAADVTGNGRLEVIALDRDGDLYLIDQGGDLIWSRNVQVLFSFSGVGIPDHFWSSPALGDVTGDGDPNIFVQDQFGIPYGFNGQGDQIWSPSNIQISIGNPGNFTPLLGSPVLADLNGNDNLEVICVFWDGTTSYLRAFDKNGDSMLSISLPGQQEEQVFLATADLSASETLEVITARSSGQVSAYNLDEQNEWIWNVSTAGEILGAPSVGDITGDGTLNVVVADNNGLLYALDSEGILEWTFLQQNTEWGSPVLADGNGDDLLNVVVTGIEEGGGDLFVIE